MSFHPSIPESTSAEEMDQGQARAYLHGQLRSIGLADIGESELDSWLEIANDTSPVSIDKLLASVFG